MPINPHLKKATFNEAYYRNKFNGKLVELENRSIMFPDDLVVRKQVQFIKRILNEGSHSEETGVKINWGSIWENWASKDFMPYELYG